MLPSSSMALPLKGAMRNLSGALPLTQKESQQLLKALTQSFRSQLDKEHGPVSENAPTQTSPSVSFKRSSSKKDNHRRPTDRHLRAILTNPLFSHPTTNPAALSTTTRDPLVDFDKAVAMGMMTPQRAAGILHAKRREINQSAALSVQDSMAESGAALRVIKWLRASGLESDFSFLSSTSLTPILLDFMVAEGLEDIAWGWMDRLMSLDGHVLHEANEKEAAVRLLLEMIRRKEETATLDNAYAAILKGEDLFKSSSGFATTFLKPWQYLSWKSTVEASTHSTPTTALYDGFVSMADRLKAPKPELLRLERAHLDLHHPSQPTADRWIGILHQQSIWDSVGEARWKSSEKRLPRSALRLMSMGLDTVQYLKNSGKEDDAHDVVEMFQKRLGSRFSETPEFSRLFLAG